MKHNPYFGQRCLEVLKLVVWLGTPFTILFWIFVCTNWDSYFEHLTGAWAAPFWNLGGGVGVFFGLVSFLVPSLLIRSILFTIILPFYRASDERQHEKEKKQVCFWLKQIQSLSSLADLSVKYFNAYEAERDSKQLIENLQKRLQKLESISQCGTEGARVCSQCGATLPPHSNICEYCGTSCAPQNADAVLPTLANDAKINECISKVLEEIAVAEEDYKANNLKKRHLYCDMTENFDLVKSELEVMGCVFVRKIYPNMRCFGNNSKMIDVEAVDRILRSKIVYFMEQEKRAH